MASTPSELSIAIVQLVFFIPVVPLSIWLWVRYGFRLGAGAWRLVLVLGLLRLISASCAVAVETLHPADSTSLYAAILSCDLVGTAPLLLLVLRLVERVNNLHRIVPDRLFRLADTSSLVGLVLGIYGANQALTSTLGEGKPFAVNAYMNAAMALFVVVLAVDLVTTGLLVGPAFRGRPASSAAAADAEGAYTELEAARKNSRASGAESRLPSASMPVPQDIESNTTTNGTGYVDPAHRHEQQQQQQRRRRSETAACKKIMLAAVLAAPFLVVRVLFAAIGDFAGDVRFIPYIGDRGLYLGMSVLMEVVAAYICLGVGFAVPPPPPKPAASNKPSWWSRLTRK